ncbi:acyl-CoA dehydrogenase family protein [Methyloferula stellata]|uniref:acyl-CoA dehydrogenase family protein n=1 Tax=Methyloferula stellata TaxID=876270 RepID=UPI0012687959|nr:acyl-CoA dehydrogenase family protein [Methyloferula stellata]
MTKTAQHLLANIQDLAPDIAARAADMEAARRMPLDLVEMLKFIGVFRVFVPGSHGGLEFDLPSALDVITALGRIDGSVGWTAMIGIGGGIFAPLLTREIYTQIYDKGPDVIFAGSVQPAGTAEAVQGGWRVNGRWPFASGCQHADWMGGFCIMTRDGKPLPGQDEGMPLIRGCFMPADHWSIEDTWHVAGLKATGSHHIVLKDVTVPDANFVDIANPVPCVQAPLARAVQQVLPLLHCANSIGVAEGALDELVALANTGRQQFRAMAPLRESEMFQAELGRAVADLRAAQGLLQMQAASHWRHAVAGTLQDEAFLTQALQTGTWIAATATRIAETCYRLAGGIALYETSPLQRRLRDMQAASQHYAVQQRHYVTAGKMVLGDPQISRKALAA